MNRNQPVSMTLICKPCIVSCSRRMVWKTKVVLNEHGQWTAPANLSKHHCPACNRLGRPVDKYMKEGGITNREVIGLMFKLMQDEPNFNSKESAMVGSIFTGMMNQNMANAELSKAVTDVKPKVTLEHGFTKVDGKTKNRPYTLSCEDHGVLDRANCLECRQLKLLL